MDETDDTGAKAHQQEGSLFIDLLEGKCKFPLGEMETPPTRFCGADTPTGAVYCLEHQKIVYSKPIRRPR